MVISINKQNFKQEIQDSPKPVVIDVYATWCGPCQYMKPIFEQLAKELGDKYVFAQLNVDEAREIAISYGITSVPTFLFINNNEVKGRITGYISQEDLRAKIQEHLG